ncbi:MAG TPA: helix-turn-helix transcriptional regulator [Solirubrobacteraceae bacterium]|jgi:ribosome-binding protein aMBF1 (putative translation factor)|nr:helix-turn-helix transcriptional regulator [Solirubrobacteraceae bacterium]
MKRRKQYGGEYGEEELSPTTVRRILRSTDRTEKHTLAHAVEVALMDYRWGHSLSQQQLAELLGMKQPQVARLESGLVNPTIETLLRISQRLGIEFTLEVRPSGLTVRPPGGESPTQPDQR